MSDNVSPEARAFMESLNRAGAFTKVRIATEVTPAKAHADSGVRLNKITTAIVRSGVAYANLAVNADRETGSLPWGEWLVYPYIIGHRDREYARLYLKDDAPMAVERFVNGEPADRDTFESFMRSGDVRKSGPVGGTISVKLENVTVL